MMQIEGIKLEAFITSVIIFGRHTVFVPRDLMSSSAARRIGYYDVGDEKVISPVRGRQVQKAGADRVL